MSYADHLLDTLPNNILRPTVEGNVMATLLLAFAFGIALCRMADSEGKQAVLNLVSGLQSVLFMLIRGLVWAMPLGIVAFAIGLVSEMNVGQVADSLGRYTLVIIGSNLLQIFIVLPLLLLAKGINPLKALAGMSPALLTAFFTKSSAATLPVTIEMAENRMGVSQKVSRFGLPEAVLCKRAKENDKTLPQRANKA